MAVVGLESIKSKCVTIMSDWGQAPLTMKQLNYTSCDTWAGVDVSLILQLLQLCVSMN